MQQRKIALYLRTATAPLGTERCPQMTAQREDLFEQIAAMNRSQEGWGKVHRIFEDSGISGRKMERPGLSQLREDVHNGVVDTVIVADISRLSRNIVDALNLIEEFSSANVKVLCFQKGPDGMDMPCDLMDRTVDKFPPLQALVGGFSI